MSETDLHEISKPMTEEQIRRITVGPTPKQMSGKVDLVDYDPAWPVLFTRENERIKSALGSKALSIEHVGSTSVPGFPAKPIIDILLVVESSADEKSYLPALEAAGYVLRIREPDWHEHRMFKGPDTNINLHVFSKGDDEIERMLIFRDWLRENPTDSASTFVKTEPYRHLTVSALSLSSIPCIVYDVLRVEFQASTRLSLQPFL
ncbi:hypothetical protein AUH73_07465 [archaeon 13_1_40CM_4_53_4]|nr:MAG: hypothetical protein AUH73_07465 [archaeon 13_1_40CM_4_53_4]